jgi:hypothetical protein
MLVTKCFRSGFRRVSQVCEKVTIICLKSVCLSDCVEQIGFYWTDFCEILHLHVFFENPSKKFQVWLKSEKNNGLFT